MIYALSSSELQPGKKLSGKMSLVSDTQIKQVKTYCFLKKCVEGRWKGLAAVPFNSCRNLAAAKLYLPLTPCHKKFCILNFWLPGCCQRIGAKPVKTEIAALRKAQPLLTM